jgi:hypothetical protein
MASALGAQSPATPAPQSAATPAPPTPNWKKYSFPEAGFNVSFPAEPKLDEKKQGAALGNILFTSYCAQIANADLCAAVIDQGPEATGLTPEALLERMKIGLELVAHTITLNEKKVDLDGRQGVEVETASDKVHITTRIYLLDNTLYQAMVTVPVTEKFPDTAHFLDSFRLIHRSKN